MVGRVGDRTAFDGLINRFSGQHVNMKNYAILKSSREALLKKAGYTEDHSIFNSVALKQMLGFHIESDPDDVGSPAESN